MKPLQKLTYYILHFSADVGRRVSQEAGSESTSSCSSSCILGYTSQCHAVFNFKNPCSDEQRWKEKALTSIIHPTNVSGSRTPLYSILNPSLYTWMVSSPLSTSEHGNDLTSCKRKNATPLPSQESVHGVTSLAASARNEFYENLFPICGRLIWNNVCLDHMQELEATRQLNRTIQTCHHLYFFVHHSSEPITHPIWYGICVVIGAAKCRFATHVVVSEITLYSRQISINSIL